MVPTGWDSWRKIKFLKEEFDCDELIQGWNLDMSGKSDTSEEENISAKKVYEEVIDHEDSDEVRDYFFSRGYLYYFSC